VIATSGATDQKLTAIDAGGTAKTLVQFSLDRPLLRLLSTDITEAMASLQNSGTMAVGFTDYNTAAPAATTDEAGRQSATSPINIPTPFSSLLRCARADRGEDGGRGQQRRNRRSSSSTSTTSCPAPS